VSNTPRDLASVASLQSLPSKPGARLATTANVALTGEQTIDGVLTNKSRVLVKSQTSQGENGLYDTASSAWTRCADADTAAKLPTGTTVSIAAGTLNGGQAFRLVLGPTTLGTDAQTWASNSGPALDGTTNQTWTVDTDAAGASSTSSLLLKGRVSSATQTLSLASNGKDLTVAPSVAGGVLDLGSPSQPSAFAQVKVPAVVALVDGAQLQGAGAVACSGAWTFGADVAVANGGSIVSPDVGVVVPRKVRLTNKHGTTITQGMACYLLDDDAVGAGSNATDTSTDIICFAAETILNNAVGYFWVDGIIQVPAALQDVALVGRHTAYLSSGNGHWTDTKPLGSGTCQVPLGKTMKVVSGTAHVFIQILGRITNP
jgi:hypothetical protein